VVVLDPIFVGRNVPISVEHIRLVPWEFASPVSISFNGIVPELLVAQAANVIHKFEKIRIEKFVGAWLGREFTLQSSNVCALLIARLEGQGHILT
jgi:hypothetical protein